jgi:hypothetical protein
MMAPESASRKDFLSTDSLSLSAAGVVDHLRRCVAQFGPIADIRPVTLRHA